MPSWDITNSNNNTGTASAASSASSIMEPDDLEQRAKTVLHLLCNQKDLDSAASYMAADLVTQHDDDAPRHSRDDFLAAWSRALSTHLPPDFRMTIREAVVDERQRKVWVRSEISGLPGGRRKESIDMMTFDERGLLARSEDCQRLIREDEESE